MASRFLDRARIAVLALAATSAASCASLDVDRETPTSGTFTSSALTFTILSFDFPGPAISVARGNASDSGRPEMIVEHETVFPYLGPLDWLLDILSVRYARISGTWGTPTPSSEE